MSARRIVLALASSFAFVAFAAQAQAPAWPTKTVRILVGSPPGGPSDITSRLFAAQLQQRTGQSVVVENRPGAGNNLAAQAVAQSEPDGHTLVLSPDTVVTTNPIVYRNLAFDARKDLVNVSVVATFTQLLVCNPGVGAKSVSDLVRMAKEKSMTYASGGPAVPGHLAAEMFLQTAGIRMQHVPYKGPAPATIAVMSGEVDCGFLATPTVIPHTKAGKLSPLAISSAEPSALAPEIPTLPKALNQPDADITFKLVLQARRGIPQPVLAELERQVAEIMKQPEIQAKLQTSDLKVVGSTSAEAEEAMRVDIARWEPVVRRLGLKMD